MHTLTKEMKSCMAACDLCSATCLQTAMHHCLEVGGTHTEPQHFRLMMTCVEVCRASAALMLMEPPPAEAGTESWLTGTVTAQSLGGPGSVGPLSPPH